MNSNPPIGLLSENDIENAILSGSLKIHPFNKRNLTGIGYNLGTTDFFLSVRKGCLERVYEKDGKRYVNISPNDTVLTFTNEHIEVNNQIAGTFHSKVKRVCEGLGHISTTLDPNWKGQLIVSISNPTGRIVEFEIESGSILTMLLYGLNSPINESHLGHDNNHGRDDLLLRYFRRSAPLSPLLSNRYKRLEEFIKKEFVRSINGTDYFSESDTLFDAETNPWTELKLQLQTDLKQICEGTYSIAPGRVYMPLKPDQYKLVIGSVLYQLLASQKNDSELKMQLSEGFHAKHIHERNECITSCLQRLIDIADYELATINHRRRIKWQNNSIIEYYSKLNGKQTMKRIMLAVLTILIVAIQAFIIKNFIKTGDKNALATIIMAVITADIPIITYFAKKWRGN